MKRFAFLLRSYQAHRFVMAVEHRHRGNDFMNFFSKDLQVSRFSTFVRRKRLALRRWDKGSLRIPLGRRVWSPKPMCESMSRRLMSERGGDVETHHPGAALSH